MKLIAKSSLANWKRLEISDNFTDLVRSEGACIPHNVQTWKCSFNLYLDGKDAGRDKDAGARERLRKHSEVLIFLAHLILNDIIL
jgi:hypothetical protein